MAGGSGKRFWPWSRRARPKQCLPVVGDASLLRQTLDRAAAVAPSERTVIVTAEANAEAVRAELLGGERVLVEPQGRNTAACVAWAASVVAGLADGGACVAVLPADHFIGDTPAFHADCRRALALAAGGSLVTLGIQPTRPETGYGWIQTGDVLAEAGDATADGRVRHVAEFKEKPTARVAAAWLAEGGRLWNSGMFFMRCDRFLDEVGRWLPEHAALFCEPGGDVVAGYSALPPISIDRGVMEKADRVVVVAASFPWSDVGSWASLAAGGEGGGSAAGLARGDVVEIDGQGNVLVGQGGLVTAVGVQGLVVVHAGDAVLVCRVDESQRVREIVEELERRGRDDVL